MKTPSATCSLAELLRFEEKQKTRESLADSLGDGLLCKTNPVFRNLRGAALKSGFHFTKRDPGGYWGWPLVHLDTVLQKRRIPYRNNRAGLMHLEAARPGFFQLADLHHNRPQPNYLLHETAHAVAFSRLFGRPRNAALVMSDQSHLSRLIFGEAYAMASEYFAACCIEGPIQSWFFSINSYRHRVPAKAVVGELLAEQGSLVAGGLVISAFVQTNFLRRTFPPREIRRVLKALGASLLPSKMEKRLARNLSEMMQMNPLFLKNTSRLFLGALGYPRNIEQHLQGLDPWNEIEQDEVLMSQFPALIEIWGL